jgi:hypothetical protein
MLTPCVSDTSWKGAPLFFAPGHDFQANYLYLNEIKRLDILTINANSFCFWYIMEDLTPFSRPASGLAS